jgi:CheY-like chemotaxis protein
MTVQRILVVDDDAEVRTRLTGLLGAAGYGVDSVADGAQALEMLKTGTRPALILLDLAMPGMNGWQFCNELKKAKHTEAQLKKIPVVVLSTDDEIMTSNDLLHAQAMLPKPLDPDRLLDTVRGYCS